MMSQPTTPQPIRWFAWALAPLMLITLSHPVMARSYGQGRPVDTNPVVGDVSAAFDAVLAVPRELTCQEGDFVIPTGGHFQGIQQATIGSGQYAIISGSSNSDSHLVLVSLEDSTAQAVWLRRLLGRPFQHAGGVL